MSLVSRLRRPVSFRRMRLKRSVLPSVRRFTSSSEAFLASVQARLAFISCGRNNVYGHPHRETLERLENAGAYVYCTCYNGMLQLRLYADGRVGVITAIS